MDPGTLFEQFVQASTFRSIQQTFFQLCIALDISPSDGTALYERIRLFDRGKQNSKAFKLWELLDNHRQQSVYEAQKACKRLNLLIIGAGPCGLRAAIECAMLGSHVIVVEEREKFSRNNVLHLWDFVIQDLKALGAKIFYAKFCTGSIEHISIRRLQNILLKVALVLGVQIHEKCRFVSLIEPNAESNVGWRAIFEPSGHLLEQYEFDVIIGADGKKNSLPGFPRRIVRGKLAIGITANFVNTRSSAEEKVAEISGVAYIFNQSFFKDMHSAMGIDLENIVYYKDETHYFVMCAKKTSLLQKGVIKKDFEEISDLLAKENVDQEMLCKFACQAADFATGGGLPQLLFAQNARGHPDIAIFDFTALSSAKFTTRLIEREGHTLILSIVGDSLHEPFWPTGSGCARGFLSVLDTAWMLRSFGRKTKVQSEPIGPMEILAQRESIYKMLAQTTKENICKCSSSYTIDPRTRYKHIPDEIGAEMDLEQLNEQIDTDNPRVRPTKESLRFRLKEGQPNLSPNFARKYSLWRFCHFVLMPFRLSMTNFESRSWGDAKALAALFGRLRSDLVDYLGLCSSRNTFHMLDSTFTAIESALGVKRPCERLTDWIRMDEEERVDYLFAVVEKLLEDRELIEKKLLAPPALSARANIGDCGSIQAQPLTGGKRVVQISTGIVTPGKGAEASRIKADDPSKVAPERSGRLKSDLVSKIQNLVTGKEEREQHRRLFDERKERLAMSKDGEQCPSTNKDGEHVKVDTPRSVVFRGFTRDDGGYTPKPKEIYRKNGQNKRRITLAGSDFETNIEEGPKLDTGDLNREGRLIRRTNSQLQKNRISAPTTTLVLPMKRVPCAICGLEVYLAEQIHIEKVTIHKKCFRCAFCEQPLRFGNCFMERQLPQRIYGNRWYCHAHSTLSLPEKMAKLDKLAQKRATSPTTNVAVVSPTQTPNISAEELTMSFVSALSSSSHYESALGSPDPIDHRSVPSSLLNPSHSPSTLVSRALHRIQQRQKMASELCKTPIISKMKSNGEEDGHGKLGDYADLEPGDFDKEKSWKEFCDHLEKELDPYQSPGSLTDHEACELIARFNRAMALKRGRSSPATPMNHRRSQFIRSGSFSSSSRRRMLGDGEEKLKTDQQLAMMNSLQSMRDFRRREKNAMDNETEDELEKAEAQHPSVKSAVKFFESQSTSTPKDTRKRTGRRRRETVAVDWNSFLTAPEEDGTPNSGNQTPSSPSKRLLVESGDLSGLFGDPDQLSRHSVASDELRPSPRNVRLVQRRADQLIRKRAEEREGKLRRELEETEQRKTEVEGVGMELERRLSEHDPKNGWTLRQWLIYVQEWHQLIARERIIRRQIRERSLSEEYQSLKKKLNELQKSNSDPLEGPNSEKEKEIMERMLAIIEENQWMRKQQEGEELNQAKESNQHSPDALGPDSSFRNFEPVFQKL